MVAIRRCTHARQVGAVVACALVAFAAGCSQSPKTPAGAVNGAAPNNALGGMLPATTSTAGNPGTTLGTSGAPTTGAGGGSAATLCDALAVFRNPCQQCHGTQRKFGAPMSLVTYSDLIAPAVTDPSKKVYELVRVRIHDTQKPMPPSGITPLTTAQLAVLDSWIDAGAQPSADPTCPDTGGTGAAGAAAMEPTMAGNSATTGGDTSTTTGTTDWPADCETHYTFLANTSGGGKYTVPAGAEQHPSFYFNPPWQGTVQAVKFKAVIDNAQVLHHWILYAQDGAFLAGWAPGNNAGDVPPDVGIYMPTGTDRLRLDVHYNNVGGTTSQDDASGVELCIISTPSKLRPHTATTYGLSASATAPAHMMVNNAATCTVTASMGPVHLIGESPHMHKLGVHAKLELARTTGEHVVVHDMPFDFNDQKAYAVSPDLILNSGDMLTTTCSYNNTTDTTVYFGQNTENEMCFNFVLYWPKGGFTCPGPLGGGAAH